LPNIKTWMPGASPGMTNSNVRIAKRKDPGKTGAF
jgi:hypothetical protein